MSSAADFDASFIAEAMPAFISEAHEQIEQLEQLLLQLEDQPGDRELLDALFRCAHTVKGSAGIFGLDRVVGFTHHVETLLDAVREGKVALTPAVSTLLLQCKDRMRTLVDAASDTTPDSAEAAAAEASLVQQLKAAGGSDVPATAVPPAAPVAAGPGTALRRWQIAVTFNADTFRNGMDPLSILNYLRGIGEIVSIACAAQAVPPLDAIDPETCHLGFRLEFDTASPRGEIEGAFSFVRDDCTLEIIEPANLAADIVARIEAMPTRPRLGDILVDAGAISRGQLRQGLDEQAQLLRTDGTAPPIGTILAQQSTLSPRVVDAALKKQGTQRAASAGDDRFIRVQADRLDAVINLLGELVIAGAGASLLARQTRQGALVEANAEITRLIEEIRNSTLQLRMVPIGETFARFRRVVRDTASELGKDVLLQIVGGETELDKSVVERIADPLMHLVRNALDHGLETPEARRAAGKPEQGTLTMSACHESGSILIRIDDDGRGIARDKVLARAWERGLVPDGVRPPDDEILRLIFEPGFSTAEKVTNLSGRGVGMDVVRRNIEALRGSVTIDSTEGHGSRIEIRLPLTLAIIDGFLVAVGDSRFIFPLDAVVEVIAGSAGSTRVDAHGRGVVELRGQALPVVDLRTLYGLEPAPTDRRSIVVVRSGTARYGVVVDALLGQHQTVIKPLGRMFRSLRGMSGSSILGNGEVALIFDVVALGRMAAEPPSSRSSAAPTLQGQAS